MGPGAPEGSQKGGGKRIDIQLYICISRDDTVEDESASVVYKSGICCVLEIEDPSYGQFS